MFSRSSFLILGLGLFCSTAAACGNFFIIADLLGLQSADRLSTSIECFGAMTTAVGVVYAGLSLREVSVAQSDVKSMQESQYIQSFLDQWNLDVEQCLFRMEQDGVANRTSDLLKIVWFFEKVDAAMRSCSELSVRFRELFSGDYWKVSDFLERNRVGALGLIPESEMESFHQAARRFGTRPKG
jgi:hypothetical protein